MQLIMKNCFIRLCVVSCFLLVLSSQVSAQGVVRNSGDISAGIGVSTITNNGSVGAQHASNVTSNYAIGYNASK